MTTLSIVVVNYNTRDKTLAALRSAVDEVVPGGSEIVVVDNGSVDGSSAAFRGSGLPLSVIEAGENLGFARAVNLGARRSSGDYVLLLNPDTVVLPGALAALVAFAQTHPQHRLYGGRTLRPDGTTDPSSCWGAPTIWSLLMFATGLSTLFRRSRVFDPESLGHWGRDTVREVPIITGCLLLIGRDDWDRLGGMDERYFLYGEDADFSTRARAAGMRPVVVPAATIVHEVGASTSSSGLKMCMVSAGKATLLRSNWAPGRARLGLILLQAGAAARSLGERARGSRDGTWTVVWRRRDDWAPGYPHAHEAIFGRKAPASGTRTS